MLTSITLSSSVRAMQRWPTWTTVSSELDMGVRNLDVVAVPVMDDGHVLAQHRDPVGASVLVVPCLRLVESFPVDGVLSRVMLVDTLCRAELHSASRALLHGQCCGHQNNAS